MINFLSVKIFGLRFIILFKIIRDKLCFLMDFKFIRKKWENIMFFQFQNNFYSFFKGWSLKHAITDCKCVG
jgi:hypothetical protein